MDLVIQSSRISFRWTPSSEHNRPFYQHQYLFISYLFVHWQSLPWERVGGWRVKINEQFLVRKKIKNLLFHFSSIFHITFLSLKKHSQIFVSLVQEGMCSNLIYGWKEMPSFLNSIWILDWFEKLQKIYI